MIPDWLNLDWQRIFVPSQPVLETVLRGSVTYLSLFVLLRMFRRQIGSVGPADLLVLLLIADASQNAMAGEYRSITDGLVLVTTIIAWEYGLDWIAYRVPWMAGIIERQPLTLVHRGQINRENLNRELMTEEELLSQLRQKGIDDVSRVKLSTIEGDGHISVIADEPSSPAASQSSAHSSGIT